MRVLLIEDDTRLTRLVARELAAEGFTVDVAHDGTTGLEQALHGGYDVAVIDWMLPGRDGPSICRSLRAAGVPTALLLLTARGQAEDQATARRSGADDYMVKPFAFADLVAHLRALPRRAPSSADEFPSSGAGGRRPPREGSTPPDGGGSRAPTGRITTPLPPEGALVAPPAVSSAAIPPWGRIARPAVPGAGKRGPGSRWLLAGLLLALVVDGLGAGALVWTLTRASHGPPRVVSAARAATVTPAASATVLIPDAAPSPTGAALVDSKPSATAAAVGASATSASPTPPGAGHPSTAPLEAVATRSLPPLPRIPPAPVPAGSIGALYRRVAASVVDIQTTIGGRRAAGSGEGSGIVLDSGHVLTNYHVVQGARTIQIVLLDGTTVPATVARSDPAEDVAVLAAVLPAAQVQPATLGDSDRVAIGDAVIAIGSPFGLDHTVTAGIISAVNRPWAPGNGPTEPMIQTDAPINPGNSGGPLLTLQGDVIGMVTAIQSPIEGFVGVGFAIPINRIKRLVP